MDITEHLSHPTSALYTSGNAALDLNRNDHFDNDAEPASDDLEIDEKEPVLSERHRRSLDRLRDSAHALKSFASSLEGDQSAEAKIEPDKLDTHEPSEEGDDFCLHGKSPYQGVFRFAAQVLREPSVFIKHYAKFAHSLLSIVQGKSDFTPDRSDRRFRDGVWSDNLVYRTLLQTYLCWSDTLQNFADDLSFEDEADRARAKFLIDQWTAAMAPSNTLFNPVAIKRAYQTGGQSLVAGLKNMLHDVVHNNAMPSQVKQNTLTVGSDLGITDGAVVYRCDQFELIQYRALGAADSTVSEVPVLVVPPQINKYYVFDLTPKNSLVRHLLESGLQVFIVSWKNPSRADSHWDLSSYVAALDGGIRAIQSITGSTKLSLASACAGGVTATALQAYYCALEKRGDLRVPKIVNHSLLVTALSARNHPILDLFVGRETVAASLSRSQQRGYMDGKELRHVFAWLRPTDLVWNFWVNNYLLGKEPPTMDVLYWDNDSTRLPTGLHHNFVDIFINNRYAQPKSIEVCGQPIDLANIDADFYLVGGDEDYLMPWKNCLSNRQLLPNANCEFVLSTGGHIQSILRPPNIANIAYYTNANTNTALTAAEWKNGAQRNKGSWWLHWSEWLRARAGDNKPAPQHLGNDAYPPLVPAPGTYVFEA